MSEDIEDKIRRLVNLVGAGRSNPGVVADIIVLEFRKVKQ